MVHNDYEHMRDMQIDSFLEKLEDTGIISNVQKDIFTTYRVYMKMPFDRDAAADKIWENNFKYKDMHSKILNKPGFVPVAFEYMEDEDVRLNLWFQIQELCSKERPLCSISR